MGDNSFAGINFQDPQSKQIFKEHSTQMCSSYKVKSTSDFIVNIKVDNEQNNNQYVVSGNVSGGNVLNKLFVKYSAANPPTYNANFSGSGLPFPTEDVAFENTPNKGVVEVVNGNFMIKIKYPNSYYDNMGTIYVEPQIKLLLVTNNNKPLGDALIVKLGQGIPFRTLTWPVQRSWSNGPDFYDNKNIKNIPVRTQYQILLDSAYPTVNKTPNNFWGLKPSC